jgi:hypothetical protein
VRGPQVVLPFINPKGQTVPELTPVGPYACQLFPYVKFSQTHVNGIDADFAMRFDLQNAGHLTGSLNYSHRFHYIFGFGADSFDLAGRTVRKSSPAAPAIRRIAPPPRCRGTKVRRTSRFR